MKKNLRTIALFGMTLVGAAACGKSTTSTPSAINTSQTSQQSGSMGSVPGSKCSYQGMADVFGYCVSKTGNIQDLCNQLMQQGAQASMSGSNCRVTASGSVPVKAADGQFPLISGPVGGPLVDVTYVLPGDHYTITATGTFGGHSSSKFDCDQYTLAGVRRDNGATTPSQYNGKDMGLYVSSGDGQTKLSSKPSANISNAGMLQLGFVSDQSSPCSIATAYVTLSRCFDQSLNTHACN